MPENEQSLSDLLEMMGKQASEVKMALYTASNTANQAVSNMNHIHAVGTPQYVTGGVASSSGSVTFFPSDTPLVRQSRAGYWLIGDREISTVVLLALVDEFFKKQERIANPPKFDTPEAAQEWLDSVS